MSHGDFLNSGEGTLYLGFHVDPIYRVHWNWGWAAILLTIISSYGMLYDDNNVIKPQ